MKIYVVGGGMLDSKAYLLVKEEGASGILIDAGCGFSDLNQEVEKHANGISTVLLTHGHFDHITALDKIIKQYSPKIYIHKADSDMLKDPKENLSYTFMRNHIALGDADVLFDDGDEITAEGINFKVMHTPGHTMGSCIFMTDGYAFSGDTLFKRSIGRSDFHHSNFESLMKSLSRIKQTLPKETIIYPGHGGRTTMEEELLNNAYLKF